MIYERTVFQQIITAFSSRKTPVTIPPNKIVETNESQPVEMDLEPDKTPQSDKTPIVSVERSTSPMIFDFLVKDTQTEQCVFQNIGIQTADHEIPRISEDVGDVSEDMIRVREEILQPSIQHDTSLTKIPETFSYCHCNIMIEKNDPDTTFLTQIVQQNCNNQITSDITPSSQKYDKMKSEIPIDSTVTSSEVTITSELKPGKALNAKCGVTKIEGINGEATPSSNERTKSFEFQKQRNLTIQNLPSIDIAKSLVIQTVFQVNIKPTGSVDVISNQTANLGYAEVNAEDVSKSTKPRDTAPLTVEKATEMPSIDHIRTTDIEVERLFTKRASIPTLESSTSKKDQSTECDPEIVYCRRHHDLMHRIIHRLKNLKDPEQISNELHQFLTSYQVIKEAECSGPPSTTTYSQNQSDSIRCSLGYIPPYINSSSKCVSPTNSIGEKNSTYNKPSRGQSQNDAHDSSEPTQCKFFNDQKKPKDSLEVGELFRQNPEFNETWNKQEEASVLIRKPTNASHMSEIKKKNNIADKVIPRVEDIEKPIQTEATPQKTQQTQFTSQRVIKLNKMRKDSVVLTQERITSVKPYLSIHSKRVQTNKDWMASTPDPLLELWDPNRPQCIKTNESLPNCSREETPGLSSDSTSNNIKTNSNKDSDTVDNTNSARITDEPNSLDKDAQICSTCTKQFCNLTYIPDINVVQSEIGSVSSNESRSEGEVICEKAPNEQQKRHPADYIQERLNEKGLDLKQKKTIYENWVTYYVTESVKPPIIRYDTDTTSNNSRSMY